ncbi:hypothetical protein ES703_100317 [subsurface metagenome]
MKHVKGCPATEVDPLPRLSLDARDPLLLDHAEPLGVCIGGIVDAFWIQHLLDFVAAKHLHQPADMVVVGVG